MKYVNALVECVCKTNFFANKSLEQWVYDMEMDIEAGLIIVRDYDKKVTDKMFSKK